MVANWWQGVCQFGRSCYGKFYLPLHFILVPPTFLFGSLGEGMRDWLFAIFLEFFSVVYTPFSQPLKTELFSGLKLDKKEGQPLKLLEIGVGCGSNFQYYPDGTDLVTVDPNGSFAAPLKENLKKYPGIRHTGHYICYGENMSEIPSESVDVVVTCHIHCSVNDSFKVLKEIHRVLVPGGKYYFVEHCVDKSPVYRRIQSFLTWTNIWGIYFCGCKFRDIPKIFEDSKVFEGTLNGRVIIANKTWFNPVSNLVAPHYLGTAIKK